MRKIPDVRRSRRLAGRTQENRRDARRAPRGASSGEFAHSHLSGLEPGAEGRVRSHSRHLLPLKRCVALPTNLPLPASPPFSLVIPCWFQRVADVPVRRIAASPGAVGSHALMHMRESLPNPKR